MTLLYDWEDDPSGPVLAALGVVVPAVAACVRDEPDDARWLCELAVSEGSVERPTALRVVLQMLYYELAHLNVEEHARLLREFAASAHSVYPHDAYTVGQLFLRGQSPLRTPGMLVDLEGALIEATSDVPFGHALWGASAAAAWGFLEVCKARDVDAVACSEVLCRVLVTGAWSG